MNLHRISIAVFFLPILVPAQTWEWSKQLGGPGDDVAYIGYVDGDENVYVYGRYAATHGMTYSGLYLEDDTLPGSNDSFLAKYGSDGSLLWLRDCYSNAGRLSILGLAFDSLNSEFYIVGSYRVDGNMDTCALSTSFSAAYLAKWNSDGHCLWAKDVATMSIMPFSTTATAVAYDPMGFVFIAGVTASGPATPVGSATLSPGSFVAKYDSDGEEIWSKQFAEYGDGETAASLIHLEVQADKLFGYGDADLYSTDDTLSIDSIDKTGAFGGATILTNIDPSTGVARWVRLDGWPHGGTSGLIPEQMQSTADGFIFVSSAFLDSAVFDSDTLFNQYPGSFGASYLAKYDSNGARVLLRQFNSPVTVGVSSVEVAEDGSIFLGGSLWNQADFDTVSVDADADMDLFIARLDSLGNCEAVDHAGKGSAMSIGLRNGSLFLAGVFPPSSVPPGELVLDGTDYTTFGWEDVVIARNNKVTSISTPKSAINDELIIFANPNNGSFRIKVPDALLNEQDLLLSIFDASGRLVRAQGLDMQEEHPRLDLNNLGKGLYTVNLAKGNLTYSGSMVVE